jgi:hypothetical protein
METTLQRVAALHEAHFTRERIPKTPAPIFLAGLLAYLEHRKVE